MLHSCFSPYQGFLSLIFLAGWGGPTEGWAEGRGIMCPGVSCRFELLQGSTMERVQELLTSPSAEQTHNPAVHYERPVRKKQTHPETSTLEHEIWDCENICYQTYKTYVSHPMLFLRLDFEWQKNIISQVALTQLNFLSLWQFLNVAAQSTARYSTNKLLNPPFDVLLRAWEFFFKTWSILFCMILCKWCSYMWYLVS